MVTAGFFALVLLAAYAGLTDAQPAIPVNDKVLHFTIFFCLTLAFYWILDTSRRRVLNYTLVVCTGCLSVGSELLLEFLPNGRVFDVLDIVANVLGSGGAIALCSWYHQRMLERKRAARQFGLVAGEDFDQDLELGEVATSDSAPQESGIVTRAEGPMGMTADEELDNWDENAEDPWDEDDEQIDIPDTKTATAAEDQNMGTDATGSDALKQRAD